MPTNAEMCKELTELYSPDLIVAAAITSIAMVMLSKPNVPIKDIMPFAFELLSMNLDMNGNDLHTVLKSAI